MISTRGLKKNYHAYPLQRSNLHSPCVARLRATLLSLSLSGAVSVYRPVIETNSPSTLLTGPSYEESRPEDEVQDKESR